MENPPNGTAPKSFDTNKKKQLFSGQKKTLKTVSVTPYHISTYVAGGGPPPARTPLYTAL